MQIYICIYRYICMELYQQQECCSLRLWLCPTPLSSSQRTWQQFHLVTSRPGQTGLSCLCFSRPRGASSVCTPLEPYMALSQPRQAEASHWERLGAHRPASRFPSRSAPAAASSLPWKSILLSTTQLTLRVHVPLQPNHLVCHRAAVKCESGEHDSRAPHSEPPLPAATPARYPAAWKHLGTVCQNGGFQGWVGFCLQFINKLDYFHFIQT